MQLNASKTKEMILGPLAQHTLPLLTTASGIIERVTTFKLLDIHMDSSLCWTTYVNNMIKKATCGLHSLKKKLKTAGLSSNQPLHYYTAIGLHLNTVYNAL